MYGNFVHATNDASHYTKPPPTLLDGVHSDAAWRTRLNRPCTAAMRPCVKLVFPLVSFLQSVAIGTLRVVLLVGPARNKSSGGRQETSSRPVMVARPRVTSSDHPRQSTSPPHSEHVTAGHQPVTTRRTNTDGGGSAGQPRDSGVSDDVQTDETRDRASCVDENDNVRPAAETDDVTDSDSSQPCETLHTSPLYT